MTASAIHALDPASRLLGEVIDRAADADQWQRFDRQLRSTGYCRRPVRLRGRIDAVDTATGEIRPVFSTSTEPDETLLKCCGNRREAVCPTCARTYRADAYQLVAAGLRGGKGVPETVTEHPAVFVTLTAPSFGPVHSRRLSSTGEPRRCRPRRDGETCPHGRSLACNRIHDEDDPRVGEPICPQCFAYEHAILWNALAPELWRLTSQRIPTELARLKGVSLKRLRGLVRVSYVKVAEYQRRGVLHFHILARLDAAQPKEQAELVQPPPDGFDTELLEQAIRAAVEHATVTAPAAENADPESGQVMRWGRQVDVRPVDPEHAHETAAYIAKYATKSTEAVGGVMHRIDATDLRTLKVRPHAKRLIECAWQLGGQHQLEQLRLRRWAHALGFRGHCFTKSRRYSTTFTRLRQARHEHQLTKAHGGVQRDPWGRPIADEASVQLRRWAYSGSGHKTAGDAWLAETGAARAAERRRIARIELHSTPPTGTALDGQHANEGRPQ